MMPKWKQRLLWELGNDGERAIEVVVTLSWLSCLCRNVGHLGRMTWTQSLI
jgi:hypothetical protein